MKQCSFSSLTVLVLIPLGSHQSRSFLQICVMMTASMEKMGYWPAFTSSKNGACKCQKMYM